MCNINKYLSIHGTVYLPTVRHCVPTAEGTLPCSIILTGQNFQVRLFSPCGRSIVFFHRLEEVQVQDGFRSSRDQSKSIKTTAICIHMHSFASTWNYMRPYVYSKRMIRHVSCCENMKKKPLDIFKLHANRYMLTCCASPVAHSKRSRIQYMIKANMLERKEGGEGVAYELTVLYPRQPRLVPRALFLRNILAVLKNNQ